MSTFRSDLFAAVSSDITSTVYFIGDAVELTVDIDIDSATTCVIQGSNAAGFRTAIAEDDWSTLTTAVSLTANTILNIEPGIRWLRGLRETASTASWARFTAAGRNVVGGRG